MTGRVWKIVGWVAGIVVGFAVAGVGVFFAVTGVDDANRWAGVLGFFVGAASLAVSVYGVVLARRAVPGPRPAPSGGGGGRQRIAAARDAFTAARDQHFDGAVSAGSGGGSAGGGSVGGVGQDVRADRDAFTAGGDQHFGQRRPR